MVGRNRTSDCGGMVCVTSKGLDWSTRGWVRSVRVRIYDILRVGSASCGSRFCKIHHLIEFLSAIRLYGRSGLSGWVEILIIDDVSTGVGSIFRGSNHRVDGQQNGIAESPPK